MNHTALVTMILASAALVATPVSAAPANVQAGTLTCTGGEGVGLIIGSKKSYRCSFAPVGGGKSEGYGATVTKIGLDLGVTGKSVMVWTVLSSSTKLDRRALAGTYDGVSADASVVVGGGAKALIGGSNHGIILQPVSVQGQTGVNLALGVAQLKLN